MISAVLLGVVVLALAAGLMLSARLVSRRPDLAQVAVEGAYLAVRPTGYQEPAGRHVCYR